MNVYYINTILRYHVVVALPGMQLNNQLLQLLGLRFADDNFDIDFDDYLTCIVRLENMFRESRR